MKKEFALRLVERLKAGQPISFEADDLCPTATVEHAVRELYYLVLEQEAKAIFGPDVRLGLFGTALSPTDEPLDVVLLSVFERYDLYLYNTIKAASPFEVLELLSHLLRFPGNVAYTVEGKGDELFALRFKDGRLQAVNAKGEACFVERSDLTPRPAHSVGQAEMRKLSEGSMLARAAEFADEVFTRMKKGR